MGMLRSKSLIDGKRPACDFPKKSLMKRNLRRST